MDSLASGIDAVVRASVAARSPAPPDGTNRTLARLLARLEPQLHKGRYAFVILAADADASRLEPVATIRESAGLTVITREARAIVANLPIAFVAAWITIAADSKLSAVGLTAALSGALASAGIACNVFAGVQHDHLFVPAPLGRRAMDALRDLQDFAAATGHAAR